MHIVQYFQGMIPPTQYGGVERIVFWLSRELTRIGHRVSVMALPGSTVQKLYPDVNLIPIPSEHKDFRTLIPDDADIVHIHNLVNPDMLPDSPHLVTEHGNRPHFRRYSPNTVFLSNSHARNHNASWYVYNGVPKEEYPVVLEKDTYMLFLAKLSWRVKNARTAIQLSLDTETPLKLTGGNLWKSRKVWGAWIVKLLFSRNLVCNPGFVGGKQKLSFLQKARILFYLVNWDEPFALAPHEALACGTPVLATPNGALAEYIHPGKNGYLVNNYEEACDALYQAKQMGAQQIKELAEYCRSSAFSIRDCALSYIKLYERVIESGNLYNDEAAARIRFRRPASVIVKK